MAMASIMSKVGPFMSIARWLLTNTGLVRYMHPSDEELKQIALVPLKEKNRKPKRSDKNNGNSTQNGVENNTFYIPKQNDIQLETTKVTLSDVVQLRYFTEYQWLLDFTFYAILVYFFTEVYISYFPSKSAQEVNLSMVWCALAIGFSYKLLMSLTGLYFEGEETGERSLVICMGFAYLFLAMLVLIVEEKTLETGMSTVYAKKQRAFFLVKKYLKQYFVHIIF